jgi:hypothetical protein
MQDQDLDSLNLQIIQQDALNLLVKTVSIKGDTDQMIQSLKKYITELNNLILKSVTNE